MKLWKHLGPKMKTTLAIRSQKWTLVKHNICINMSCFICLHMYYFICTCSVKGPNHVLSLGPWLRTWAIKGRVNGNEWFKPRIQWAKYRYEDSLRRNISSDIINLSQIRIPTITITFQEAPVIKMCLMNIRERRKPKNI